MPVTISRSTDQDQLFSNVPTFPFMHLITVLVATLKRFEITAKFKSGTVPKHFAHWATISLWDIFRRFWNIPFRAFSDYQTPI